MQTTIHHLYKLSNDSGGLLYAWFSAMHTRVDIMLYSRKPEEELLLIVNQIYDEVHRLEKMANYYDPASELACVNRMASVSPVVLSEELYAMIDLCMKYNTKTLGCFDITIHSDDYNQNTIQTIRLSADKRSIFFQREGVTVNLSGFLKGYALDSIRNILNANGIENALVNMGNSSVLALGNHPAGSGWKVDFGSRQDMLGDNNEKSILLHNECLTTSGNETIERRHIISPQSGRLIEGINKVAVVTENGAIGEILSTSLFVADAAQREALITGFPNLLNRVFF